MPEKEENRTRRRAEELFDLVKTGDQHAYELLGQGFGSDECDHAESGVEAKSGVVILIKEKMDMRPFSLFIS